MDRKNASYASNSFNRFQNYIQADNQYDQSKQSPVLQPNLNIHQVVYFFSNLILYSLSNIFNFS